VDLVQISRIRRVEDRWKERFRKRVFTEAEIRLCAARPRPAAAFAMRFAAKEAASKALGTGFRQGVAWRDIEVTHNEHGKPGLNLYGKAARVAHSLGVNRLHVSMSDDGAYAVAMVVLEA